MTSQTGQKNIAIHILPNISRGGNQVMKFGNLREYKVRSIFLQKSCRTWGRATNSRTFLLFNKALY